MDPKLPMSKKNKKRMREELVDYALTHYRPNNPETNFLSEKLDTTVQGDGKTVHFIAGNPTHMKYPRRKRQKTNHKVSEEDTMSKEDAAAFEVARVNIMTTTFGNKYGVVGIVEGKETVNKNGLRDWHTPGIGKLPEKEKTTSSKMKKKIQTITI